MLNRKGFTFQNNEREPIFKPGLCFDAFGCVACIYNLIKIMHALWDGSPSQKIKHKAGTSM